MFIKCFEEIIAWKKAREFINIIYGEFKDNNDYSFKNQIQRAAVSIMNNIAEGFERKSKENKEFRRFLLIAKGSSGEVRSMLYLALDFNYISKEKFVDLNEKAREISRLIAGFIKTL